MFTWLINVYDLSVDCLQGFEVVIHGRKYFAFSMYKGSGSTAVSYCDRTLPGWTHDVLGHDWACFSGQKTEAVKPKWAMITNSATRLVLPE